ncbi:MULTISPECIES: hypothetical protein [unclassified Sphingomonas]|uniref:hypothetical protein n=1 Tax=unclassified Sphingomonas TaxID=196159 RepID=UPI00226A0628|nr:MULTISPECIES: hypothetical protein [unclassified Sphingomonas]
MSDAARAGIEATLAGGGGGAAFTDIDDWACAAVVAANMPVSAATFSVILVLMTLKPVVNPMLNSTGRCSLSSVRFRTDR